MQKNTLNSYAPLTRWIHWTMGVIIITLLTVGFIMTDMQDGDLKWTVYGVHKAVGLIVLATIGFRIIWRFMNPEPELPKALPRWQKLASRINIRLLYVLMVVMPVSGFSMSYLGGYPIGFFGLFTIPPYGPKLEIAKGLAEIHETSGLILAYLVGLHVAAGLYHHLVRKDNVLLRMLGRG